MRKPKCSMNVCDITSSYHPVLTPTYTALQCQSAVSTPNSEAEYFLTRQRRCP